MIKDDFQYIWTDIILVNARKICDKYNVDDIVKYKIILNDKGKFMDMLYASYDNIRKNIKDRYIFGKPEKEDFIDQHKIASCICASLIEHKILCYDIAEVELRIKNNEDVKFLQDLLKANYVIAFYSSVGILYLFMLNEYKNKNDILKTLCDQGELLFPITNIGHDTYEDCIVKTLMFNDMSGSPFDILMYSNVMFWIDLYNKNLLQCL